MSLGKNFTNYLHVQNLPFGSLIDTGFKSIEVADLDGKNNLDVLKIGLNEPRAIAVDPFQGGNHSVHTYLQLF